MAKRGSMTGTLTAIWRILIWGLAAVLLLAVWMHYSAEDELEQAATPDTEAEEVAEPATATEDPVEASPEAESAASDSDPAAVEAAPDADSLPESVEDATDGGVASDAVIEEDGAAGETPAQEGETRDESE